MTKIGYIGGSFKPYHAGHHAIVRVAANECNIVNLYVSLADRSREGEYCIKGKAMHEIWAKYLLAIMPSNVDVHFTTNPVRAIYEAIGEADKSDNTAVAHIVYSDDSDSTKNYPEKNLIKYFPRLKESEQINVKPFHRTETVNVSGTIMRKLLQLGLSEEFIKGLPEPVQEYGMNIWKILGGND